MLAIVLLLLVTVAVGAFIVIAVAEDARRQGRWEVPEAAQARVDQLKAGTGVVGQRLKSGSEDLGSRAAQAGAGAVDRLHASRQAQAERKAAAVR